MSADFVKKVIWVSLVVIVLAVLAIGAFLGVRYILATVPEPTPTVKVEAPEVKVETTASVCLDVVVEGSAVTFAVYQDGKVIDWHAVSFTLAGGQQVTVRYGTPHEGGTIDFARGFKVYLTYGGAAEPIGLCPWTRLTAAPQPTPTPASVTEAPPVVPQAPAGSCEDNKTLQNESQPDETRVPLFQSGTKVYSALGWKPGNGFAGYSRIHIVLPDTSEYQATFDVGSEGDVSRTGYCGTREEIAANAVNGQVEFHRQASQDDNGNRPSADEIPVFYLDLSGRLETVKDGPLGPPMDQILARLSLSQEGVGTIQIVPDGKYTGGQAGSPPPPPPPSEEKGAGVCAPATEAASATGSGAFTAPADGIAVFSYGEGDAQQKRVTALRQGESFDAKGVVGFAFWTVSPGCANLDTWAATDPVASDGRTFVASGGLQGWIDGLGQ